MGVKEIVTYISALVGLIMVCRVRMSYAKRQQVMPDNVYSKEEKKTLYIGYVILAVAFVLACIPIY